MNPDDARLVLRALQVGRVAERLLNAGLLDEVSVLARMSEDELDLLARFEYRAQRACESTENPQACASRGPVTVRRQSASTRKAA